MLCEPEVSREFKVNVDLILGAPWALLFMFLTMVKQISRNSWKYTWMGRSLRKRQFYVDRYVLMAIHRYLVNLKERSSSRVLPHVWLRDDGYNTEKTEDTCLRSKLGSEDGGSDKKD